MLKAWLGTVDPICVEVAERLQCFRVLGEDFDTCKRDIGYDVAPAG